MTNKSVYAQGNLVSLLFEDYEPINQDAIVLSAKGSSQLSRLPPKIKNKIKATVKVDPISGSITIDRKTISKMIRDGIVQYGDISLNLRSYFNLEDDQKGGQKKMFTIEQLTEKLKSGKITEEKLKGYVSDELITQEDYDVIIFEFEKGNEKPKWYGELVKDFKSLLNKDDVADDGDLDTLETVKGIVVEGNKEFLEKVIKALEKVPDHSQEITAISKSITDLTTIVNRVKSNSGKTGTPVKIDHGSIGAMEDYTKGEQRHYVKVLKSASIKSGSDWTLEGDGLDNITEDMKATLTTGGITESTALTQIEAEEFLDQRILPQAPILQRLDLRRMTELSLPISKHEISGRVSQIVNESSSRVSGTDLQSVFNNSVSRTYDGFDLTIPAKTVAGINEISWLAANFKTHSRSNYRVMERNKMYEDFVNEWVEAIFIGDTTNATFIAANDQRAYCDGVLKRIIDSNPSGVFNAQLETDKTFPGTSDTGLKYYKASRMLNTLPDEWFRREDVVFVMHPKGISSATDYVRQNSTDPHLDGTVDTTSRFTSLVGHNYYGLNSMAIDATTSPDQFDVLGIHLMNIIVGFLVGSGASSSGIRLSSEFDENTDTYVDRIKANWGCNVIWPEAAALYQNCELLYEQ